jgi:hypothetical protein
VPCLITCAAAAPSITPENVVFSALIYRKCAPAEKEGTRSAETRDIQRNVGRIECAACADANSNAAGSAPATVGFNVPPLIVAVPLKVFAALLKIRVPLPALVRLPC